MAKNVRILFHGFILLLGAFSGCFCMVFMVQGIAVEDKEIQHTEIVFPFRVSGTDLVVLAMVATDGDVCVANPDAPKFHLASVLLKNEGSEWISKCKISIGDGVQEWSFEANMLPPDSETLVLESSRKSYPHNAIFSCKGEAETFTPNPANVVIEDNDMCSFFVSNMENAEILKLRIYYKSYYPEWNLYDGGIAHECVVVSLQPGEERQVFPEYYAGEYSKILFAEGS